MSDRSVYVRGCEFVDDELTCTIEVSGVSGITLKFRDECLYSCISKRLFNKIKKEIGNRITAYHTKQILRTKYGNYSVRSCGYINKISTNKIQMARINNRKRI